MLQKVMSKFGSKTVLPAHTKGSAVSESTVSLSKDRNPKNPGTENEMASAK